MSKRVITLTPEEFVTMTTAMKVVASLGSVYGKSSPVMVETCKELEELENLIWDRTEYIS